jgi:hypothetical protein
MLIEYCDRCREKMVVYLTLHEARKWRIDAPACGCIRASGKSPKESQASPLHRESYGLNPPEWRLHPAKRVYGRGVDVLVPCVG